MFKRIYTKCLNQLHVRFDSELFHYEDLRRMFLPLILDQLFIFGIGILSTAMASSSGNGAMAAVSLASVIGNLAYAIYASVSTGGAIIIARAKGAGDPVKIREAIGQSACVCVLLGTTIGLIMTFLGEPLVRLFYPTTDPVVVAYAGAYMRPYGLSLLPYSLFVVIFNTFRSLGDSKSSLYLTIVINSIHLICTYIYINILHMGVPGAALSYLTARVIGTAFALYWIMCRSDIAMKWRDFFRFRFRIIKEITFLGVPLSIEQILFQGGMLLVQMYIARLPVAEMDANGIANSVFSLYSVVSFALTSMVATVCGQCLGAGNLSLCRRYCKSFVGTGRIILLISSVILFPLTPLILKLYSPSAQAITFIYPSIAIAAVSMPLIWCDAYLLSTATRAAGDAKFTTFISLLALGIGRMGTGYLLTISLGMGITGVWLGQTLEWVVRAFIMRIRFRGQRWIHLSLSQQD